MSDYIIREWKPGDRSALKALWKCGFGDSDEVIDGFHSLFLKPGRCIVAEADGKPVSAMYILPGQVARTFRQNTLTAGYTYALATLPEYRGRGIGSAVYRACCEKVLENEDMACVIPADAALFPLYENANGAKPVAVLREAHFFKSDLTGIASVQAARVPVSMYMWLRENLMAGLPHVTLDEGFYDLLEDGGMDFFTIGGKACAAAEVKDGVCYIRELIDPGEDNMSCISTVSKWCPADEYIVRTPLFFRGPGEVRPYALGLIKVEPDYPMPEDLWWGFGLE